MTGLLSFAHPVTASAASADSDTKTSTSSNQFDVTWSGGDDSTVVEAEHLTGGGATVTYR